MAERELPKLSFLALSRSHSPSASVFVWKKSCRRLPVSESASGTLTHQAASPRALRDLISLGFKLEERGTDSSTQSQIVTLKAVISCRLLVPLVYICLVRKCLRR